MPRVRRGVWGGPLMLACVLAVGTLAPGGGPSTEATSTLEARHAELRTLQERITATRAQIARLREEGQDLEHLLAELERDRSLTRRYLTRLEQQQQDLEARIAAGEADLARQEAEQTAVRGEWAEALVCYYKEHRVTAAELIVSSASFGELFTRGYYWVRTIRRLRDRQAEIETQRTAIAEELAAIESDRTAVAHLQAERRAQLGQLDAAAGVRRRHQRELEQQIAAYERQRREMLAAQEEIERLIRAAQEAAVSETGAGLAGLEGRLPWPVAGDVVARFGTQIHPRYGTRVQRNGVQIAAAEGTPICAVAAGWVVYAGWLSGYGEMVVLDHGQGYFSLYAHASELLVTQGERVGRSAPIARVGSTDALRGSGLHFEIRRGSTALDPLRWLRRKGRR